MQNLDLEKKVEATTKKLNDLTFQINKLSLPGDVENVKREFDQACNALKKLKDELKSVVSNSVNLNANFISSGLSVLDVKVDGINKSLNKLCLAENSKYIKESLTDINDSLESLKKKLDKAAVDVENLPILADIEELNDNINLKLTNTETIFIDQVREINQNINTKLTNLNKNISNLPDQESFNTIKDIVSSSNRELEKHKTTIEENISRSVNSGTEAVTSKILLLDTKLNENFENKISPVNSELAKISSKVLWISNNLENISSIKEVKILQDEVSKVQEQIELASQGLEKNISKLENKLADNIKSLMSDLSNKIGALDALMKNSSSLTIAELKDSFNSLEELTAEIANKQEKQATNEDLELDFDEIKTEILLTKNDLNENLEKLTTKIADKQNDQATNEQLNAIKDDIKTEIASLESLAVKIADKQNNQPTNQEISNLQNDLTNLYDIKSQIEPLLKDLSNKIGVLEALTKNSSSLTITELKESINCANDSIQNRFNSLAESIDNLDEIKIELHSTKNTITEALSNNVIPEISRVTDVVTAKIASLETLTTEIADRQENQPTKEDLKSQLASINNSFNFKDEIKTEIASLESLAAKIADRQENQPTNQEISNLQNDLTNLTDDIANLIQEKNELLSNELCKKLDQQESSDIKSQIEPLFKDISDKIGALNVLMKNSLSLTTTELSESINSANDSIQNRFNSLAKTMDNLAYSDETLNTQKQINDLKDELKTELHSVKNTITETLSDDVIPAISRATAQATAQATDTIAKIASLETLTTEIADKQENQPTQEDLKSQLASINNNFNSLTETIDTLAQSSEVIDTQKQLSKFKDDIKTEIASLESLAAKIADRQDNQPTNQDISTIQNDLTNLADILEDSHVKLSDSINTNIESARKNQEYCKTLEQFISDIQLFFGQIDNKFSSNAMSVNEQFDLVSSNLSGINEQAAIIKNLIEQLPVSENTDSIKQQLLDLTDKLNSFESIIRNSSHLTIDAINESFNKAKSDIQADIQVKIETLSSLIQNSAQNKPDSIDEFKSQLLSIQDNFSSLKETINTLAQSGEVLQTQKQLNEFKDEIITEISSITLLAAEIANNQDNPAVNDELKTQLLSIQDSFKSLVEKDDLQNVIEKIDFLMEQLEFRALKVQRSNEDVDNIKQYLDALKSFIEDRSSKIINSQNNLQNQAKESTVTIIKEIKPLFEENEKTFNSGTLEISNNLENLSKETTTLNLIVNKINSSLEKVNLTNSTNNNELISSIKEIIEENKETKEKISLLNNTSNKSFEIIETLVDNINSTQDSLMLLAGWVDGAGGIIESISADIQDTKKAQKNYDKKFTQLTSDIEKINANQEIIQKSLEKIEKALRI